MAAVATAQTGESTAARRGNEDGPRAGRRPFRIAAIPHTTKGNPGLDLFYGGLRAHGIDLVGRLDCSPTWLRRHADELDAIHLHWPEKIWRGRTSGRLHRIWKRVSADSLRGVLRVGRTLDAARSLGLKRLWTVHNVEPHEGASWLDRWGYRVVADKSDLLICYSRHAAELISEKYRPAGRMVAMTHGNYNGIYPSPRDRRSVLTELGLSHELPVVCCVGCIRPYKGLDVAFEAVGRLAGAVQLIVAGSPYSSADLPGLERLAAAVPTARLVPRSLTDQEFSDVIAASEAVILPFHQITGSGSLLASWTLGRGIVASDLPLFREMLEPAPGAGETFKPRDAADCAAAITRFLRAPAEQRRKAALAAASYYSWERCVEPVVEAIREWTNR